VPGQRDTRGHNQGGGQREYAVHAHEHKSGSPAIIVELREHLPFSVSAVAIGLIVAGTICIVGFSDQAAGLAAEHLHEHDHDHDHTSDPARLFFHLFHPAHMLFSAAATAAMFCRYERRVGKAIIIGLIGAIGVCGLSDIAFPHASLLILGVHTPMHVCVWEHPTLVMPFAAVGVLIGIGAASSVSRSTIISHSLHVLVSTMASIFYMVGPLGMIAWIDALGKVFVFVIVAVMIPCCLSDIVFPLLLSKAGRDLYRIDPLPHP
jgi:hypothetical protein